MGRVMTPNIRKSLRGACTALMTTDRCLMAARCCTQAVRFTTKYAMFDPEVMPLSAAVGSIHVLAGLRTL